MSLEQITQIRKTILEFFARLVMNTIKLIIGLSLGVAINFQGAAETSQLISSKSIMLVLVALAIFISAIETWQDWEQIPVKPADDEPANA